MLARSAEPEIHPFGDNSRTHGVTCCEGMVCRTQEQDLIGEEPLMIRVEGRPYSVVMRTPGEEVFHAAGFCLGEGLVDGPEDFATIGCCDQKNTNVATVTLQPARREKVADLLKRRGFISQTSCGICGKEVIEDLCQVLIPSRDQTRISMNQAMACAKEMAGHQRLYEMTKSSHAALIFDSRLRVMAVAEDVGRHNALDKAIGKALMKGTLWDAVVGVVSSRISYELVQKATRAQLPILIGLSRPTGLAVALGKALNMTLACAGKEDELAAYCGLERLQER
jgi:FdhD protein